MTAMLTPTEVENFAKYNPHQLSESETVPYQIIATKGRPAETSPSMRHQGLRQAFGSHVPKRPYCTDDLQNGIRPREKQIALRHRFIQLNGPSTFEWVPFDIDRAGAYFATEDANLPPANVVMVNKVNGHAHHAYLLASPVAKHSLARIKPLEYFASVQRGCTNRLGADKHFSGLITKNPAHDDWHVEWRRENPYSLDEMADWLFEKDTRFDPRPEASWGAGRNVATFDELRTFAYREVLKFNRSGRDFAEFGARLEAVGNGINLQFETPLNRSEVRAISKSVAKWTWRRFSPEQFSKIQRARVNQRWLGKEVANTLKPWLALGISRATYYRQKSAHSRKDTSQ